LLLVRDVDILYSNRAAWVIQVRWMHIKVTGGSHSRFFGKVLLFLPISSSFCLLLRNGVKSQALT
jgi:hypothetical protein